MNLYLFQLYVRFCYTCSHTLALRLRKVRIADSAPTLYFHQHSLHSRWFLLLLSSCIVGNCTHPLQLSQTTQN